MRLLILLAVFGVPAWCCVDASTAEPPVTALAVTPDGDAVIAASQSGLTVLQWPSLKVRQKIRVDLVNLHDLAFSPGGGLLAVSGGTPAEQGKVQILRWPGGKIDGTLEGYHDDSVMTSRWIDDDQIITCSLDHGIALWDRQQRRVVREFHGHSRGVTSVGVLGATILTSGGIDQSIRVWDLESSDLSRTLNNHTREVRGLSVRPSAGGLPMIASISRDRTVRFWQPTIGRMVRFLKLDTEPTDVAWLADGKHVVVSTTAGEALLIDPDTVSVLQRESVIEGRAFAIAVHPDGTAVIGGTNGLVRRVSITP